MSRLMLLLLLMPLVLLVACDAASALLLVLGDAAQLLKDPTANCCLGPPWSALVAVLVASVLGLVMWLRMQTDADRVLASLVAEIELANLSQTLV